MFYLQRVKILLPQNHNLCNFSFFYVYRTDTSFILCENEKEKSNDKPKALNGRKMPTRVIMLWNV